MAPQQLSLDLREAALVIRASTSVADRVRRYREAVALSRDAAASRRAADNASRAGNRDDVREYEQEANQAETKAVGILSELRMLERADLEAVQHTVRDLLARQERYADESRANGARGPKAEAEYAERQRDIMELREVAQHLADVLK